MLLVQTADTVLFHEEMLESLRRDPYVSPEKLTQICETLIRARARFKQVATVCFDDFGFTYNKKEVFELAMKST